MGFTPDFGWLRYRTPSTPDVRSNRARRRKNGPDRAVHHSFVHHESRGKRDVPRTRDHRAGIAFDAGQGIREVAFSSDGGRSWRVAELGRIWGEYSFREWRFRLRPANAVHMR